MIGQRAYNSGQARPPLRLDPRQIHLETAAQQVVPMPDHRIPHEHDNRGPVCLADLHRSHIFPTSGPEVGRRRSQAQNATEPVASAADVPVSSLLSTAEGRGRSIMTAAPSPTDYSSPGYSDDCPGSGVF